MGLHGPPTGRVRRPRSQGVPRRVREEVFRPEADPEVLAQRKPHRELVDLQLQAGQGGPPRRGRVRAGPGYPRGQVRRQVSERVGLVEGVEEDYQRRAGDGP